MVDTDQAGFHVSGWKSLIDKHNLDTNLAQYLLTSTNYLLNNDTQEVHM